MCYVREKVDFSSPNTEFGKSGSFSFIGANMWNTVAYHIRTAPILSAFKKTINSLVVI